MAKSTRGGRTPNRSTNQRTAPGGARSTPAAATRDARVPRIAAIGVAGVVGILVRGVAMAVGFGGSGDSRPGGTSAVTAVVGVPAADIGPAEASARWQAGAVLLDVREDAEWAAGHVPGAIHIPLGQLASRVAELPAGQPILVICRSGNRSQEGRDILLSAGLSPVASVDGGVRAWRDAGLPFEGQVA